MEVGEVEVGEIAYGLKTIGLSADWRLTLVKSRLLVTRSGLSICFELECMSHGMAVAAELDPPGTGWKL